MLKGKQIAESKNGKEITLLPLFIPCATVFMQTALLLPGISIAKDWSGGAL